MLNLTWCVGICAIIAISCLLLIFVRGRIMNSEREDLQANCTRSPKRRNRRGKNRGKDNRNAQASTTKMTTSQRSVRQRRKVRIADNDIPDERTSSEQSSLTSASASYSENQEETMEVDVNVLQQEKLVKSQRETDENDKISESKRRKGNEVKHQGSPSKLDGSPNPKDFSHPIYKQMSLKNGLINRMSKTELQTTLRELQCNNSGSGDVLKRRLKNYYSKQMLSAAGLPTDVPVRYDYLCVIDVEATCLEYNPPEYLHEIIEFPIVLVNTRTLRIEDTFESFCKPVVNPKLSKFCSQLTHISQKMVDKAEEFPAVLKRVEAWMESKGLGTKFSFAVATDCSLDMDLYLKTQCILSRIPYPQYAQEWVNVSKVFANIYKTKRVPLRAMLDSIGLEFAGQPHRGVDDARNIARIAMKLFEDGADLKCNEKLT